MKWLSVIFCGFLFFGVTSCEKYDKEKWDKKKHEYGECGVGAWSMCDDTRFEDPYIQSDNLEVFILSPLVVSDECNCIVEGKVKYVENGKTAAMVYYYSGECGGEAKKVFCIDGNCDSKKSPVCYFYPANCNEPDQTND